MWNLAYQKHGFVVSGQRSHLTDAYCNVVCFVLRPSFVCVLFFRRTLYSVKEVVDWFLLPLATTRLTMVNLIVISLLLIMVILWLHNCRTTGFHSWETWLFTFCGCGMMGVYKKYVIAKISRNCKGSAMRIQGNKPKGKKCIKKTQWINNHAEIRTYTMIASSAWGQLPDHWALLLLDNSYRTIKILTAFFSAIHAIWSLWSCIYHEIKEI